MSVERFNTTQFEALAKLIRMLPDSTSRRAAELVFVGGLSISDAAKECGTTYVAAHRAVKRVREAYDLALTATTPRPSSTKSAQPD